MPAWRRNLLGGAELGSKQGLFAAAVEMSPQLPPAIETIFADGLDGFGERIVGTLVETIDASGRTPLAMLLQPTRTSDQSETLIRECIDREITSRVAALLGTPDAAFRAGPRQ
ncbi:hypothetical protein [Nonomuraea sp. NPDC001023]|uniref:TetR/AcrR family transcriptional regulator n=1 Tax=unclassified Nonomuraea TaxID=2593643 RepID=UPI0033185558